MNGDTAIDPILQAAIDRAVAEAVDARLGALENQVRRLAAKPALEGQEDRCTIVAFSGEMDNLLACFNIASAAAAMGMEVSIFFTFWGINALRRSRRFRGKPLGERLVAMMLPKGPGSVATSRMNMGGMGPVFFKHLMGRRGVADLPSMIDTAKEIGVRMIACEMSMGVMGVTRDELIDGIDFGGAATYLDDAARSKITLFI